MVSIGLHEAKVFPKKCPQRRHIIDVQKQFRRFASLCSPEVRVRLRKSCVSSTYQLFLSFLRVSKALGGCNDGKQTRKYFATKWQNRKGSSAAHIGCQKIMFQKLKAPFLMSCCFDQCFLHSPKNFDEF